MEANKVDITGIDRGVLLRSLWFNTAFVGLGVLKLTSEPDESEIDLAIVRNRADYITGKPIKVQGLSSGFVDPTLYDQFAGRGKFKFVVDTIRNSLVKN